MKKNENFMQLAIKEAKKGIAKKEGGPFGAVIVCKGKVIAKSHNTVLRNKDATSHAEINVIRIASKKLKKFDLSNCELYATCMPCPMCLSAIYWAKIKKVYFGADSIDAAKIGFDDKKIYDFLKKNKNNMISLNKVKSKECVVLMDEFVASKGKLY